MASPSGGARAPRNTGPGRKRKNKRLNQEVKGGIAKRAKRRNKTLGGVGGVRLNDGVTRREARKVRKAWIRAGKPKPKAKPKPYNPLDPLTGKAMKRELDALTQLEYGGQLRELDQQRRISDQFSQNLGGYYQNYQQMIQNATAQQQAYQRGVQDAAYQQANLAAQTDQSQNAALLQQQQQEAQKLGASGVNPALQSTMQQAVAARQQMGTAGANYLASQGQAQAGHLAGLVGVAGQQGGEALDQERRRRLELEGLGQELQGEMGRFRVATRGKLREGERTYALNRAAFNLDVTQERNRSREARRDDRRLAKQDRFERRQARIDAKLDRATKRADLGDKKTRNRLDRLADIRDDGKRNYSTDYSEWAQRTRPDKGDGKGGKSNFTPTQRRASKDKYQTGLAIAKRNSNKGPSWLYRNMIDAGYPPLMARAIARRATGSSISPSLARKFNRQYGLNLHPRRGKRSPGRSVQRKGTNRSGKSKVRF